MAAPTDFNAFVKAKEVEASFLTDEKRAEQETIDFIYRGLKNCEWGDYGVKVKKVIRQLTEKYGTPSVGRTRAVFDTKDGFVIKVPFTDEGEFANGNEFRASEAKDSYIPVAKCDYVKISGVDALKMEKVRIVKTNYKNMPDWVGYVDCGQVGYNSKNELVAYDL